MKRDLATASQMGHGHCAGARHHDRAQRGTSSMGAAPRPRPDPPPKPTFNARAELVGLRCERDHDIARRDVVGISTGPAACWSAAARRQ
jgi:hypothetical protein